MKTPFAFRKGTKVEGAAFSIGRVIYTGEHHADLWDKAHQEHPKGIDPRLINEGYFTNTNRMVDRKEGFAISKRYNSYED